MPKQLYLTRDQWDQMRAEVESRAPEEACGLLAGSQGLVRKVFLIDNTLHSPTRFRMDPVQQWQAFQQIEQNGWELFGIFHSHPQGPESPSDTDLAEAFYPDVVHLIWSRAEGEWRCRGFYFQDKQICQVRVILAG
jgi:proteasome lid subunit RPN8/RPN11